MIGHQENDRGKSMILEYGESVHIKVAVTVVEGKYNRFRRQLPACVHAFNKCHQIDDVIAIFLEKIHLISEGGGGG